MVEGVRLSFGSELLCFRSFELGVRAYLPSRAQWLLSFSSYELKYGRKCKTYF